MKVKDLVALGLEDAAVVVSINGVEATDQVQIIHYEPSVVVINIERP